METQTKKDSPHPFEHISQILSKEGAGKTLLHFVIPGNRFVDSSSQFYYVQHRDKRLSQHQRAVMSKSRYDGWFDIISSALDQLSTYFNSAT